MKYRGHKKDRTSNKTDHERNSQSVHFVYGKVSDNTTISTNEQSQ